MKRILFILSILLSAFPSFAQEKKNQLDAGFGGYTFYDHVDQLDVRLRKMLHFTYKRQITSKLGVFASCSLAPMGAWLLTAENSIAEPNSIGKIETRNKYQFFDLGISYALLTCHAQKLSVTAGPSLAYGENAYKTKLIMAPGGNYGQGDIIDVAYDWKKESYFGITAGIRYDYFFWKNRINAGADFAVREYAHSFPFQINYGLHLGYHF